VSRLQEVINKILREAGKRTREEVETTCFFVLVIYNVAKYEATNGEFLLVMHYDVSLTLAMFLVRWILFGTNATKISRN